MLSNYVAYIQNLVHDSFVRSLKPASKLIDDRNIERSDNERSVGIKKRRRRHRRGDSQSPLASFEAKHAESLQRETKVRTGRRRSKSNRGSKLSWVGNIRRPRF